MKEDTSPDGEVTTYIVNFANITDEERKQMKLLADWLFLGKKK
jgi:hypothetical protein